MNTLKKRVLKAFSLTEDFYSHVKDDNLRLKISNVPSNSIGEQAYCIIGARESYLKAFNVGEWSGFECSLIDTNNKSLIIKKLKEAYSNIEVFLENSSTDQVDINLLIDLLEHEIQHHGQLIRVAYANRIKFPESWKVRYTV